MTPTGPPWDHHGTPAADWPLASHLCHLPAPPWPRSVAFHEPLAWPQQALGQRAVATGHFGSQEGEQARDIGMGAPCSTRVPEPCATAGAVTPRGLQGRRHSTRQGPHRMPQLQTQLARAPRAASSWPHAARCHFCTPARHAEPSSSQLQILHGTATGERKPADGDAASPCWRSAHVPPPAAATTGTRGPGTPAPGASAAGGGAASPSSDPKCWLLG